MSEIRHVIKLTVREVVEYEIRLDVDDLEDFPEEILKNRQELQGWLIDNEDVYVDEICDDNFVGCEDREITEIKVLRYKRKKAA
ncbi:hypothetical protein Ssi03_13070 [Sphaerisporangium siamense]|uniref:Uncharacterized protein n=1 Tax=Sphaerisporangium siamense TaxID=795645 RepID=A0A7W7GBX3_9ACTN|nr:hypothetical protein [Sphaerisporangium siamense]MBB4702924.1 hypothetical protein [Sphaerisporangium siamense]GII83317.1 hypothetical protein Ssi03_13070 [Sphaerisporangium siamense]